MQIYNNTVISQWPTAGYAFGGTVGGSMQDSYACLMNPSRAKSAYFGDSYGRTTTSYLRNRIDRNCAEGLRSLSVSLAPVSNTGGVLTGNATVQTVEFGMQGVVFAVDGRYVSAVRGSGPYTLKYGAAGLASGSHTVTATVVDAVGLLAVSGKQSIQSTAGWVLAAQSVQTLILQSRTGVAGTRTTLLTAGIKGEHRRKFIDSFGCDYCITLGTLYKITETTCFQVQTSTFVH
jgi:hypothetical protein